MAVGAVVGDRSGGRVTFCTASLPLRLSVLDIDGARSLGGLQQAHVPLPSSWEGLHGGGHASQGTCNAQSCEA
eukprot:366501-Chlamydomonas_euryale.AAC.30